ncbi:MAG: nucleotidyltransferase family protein [Alphaproteobacteria bacterium]|jgi:dTDP-glucose pyrophosphorylase|nr:nucleotidyltransferase family protein [Alphaproteobacteria bacterium]
MQNNWSRIALKSDVSIKSAMEVLDATGLRIVLIIDENGHLLATVTDGDIRRGLLKGIGLSSPVSEIMNNNPISLSSDLTKGEILDILKHTGVLAVPLVGEDKKVIGLETIDSIDENLDTDACVVLMAGGFGKRLMPLTNALPKPMLPIDGRPIIEHIVENLRLQGFKKFIIAMHYKSEMIQNHFQKKQFSDITLDCIHETEPLGTAGALYLLKEKINTDFIVMNSDLVTKINFRNLLLFHQQHKGIGTICTKDYQFQVPFGVVCSDKMKLSRIIEKPTYSYLVSAGVYCFSSEALKYIKTNEYLDMPTFLQNLVDKKQNINIFPIHEHWMDIGNMSDYQKAQMVNS